MSLTNLPIESALKEMHEGARAVYCQHDPLRDIYRVTLDLDGYHTRRGHYGAEEAMLTAVDRVTSRVLDHATMVQWLATRRRPRLGAGTVGYTRRRR